MRVLFIGDPHLKISRFDLATNFLGWLNKLITEQRPDLVVNLGDTFDTHAVLRSEVLNEFLKHVNYVLSLNIPYVYLVGNHDMYKPNDPKYHAMLPFKGKIKDLYVVDEVTDLFDTTFVPYQHNEANFPRKTLPVVVAHQTFIGADYGPIRNTENLDPSSLTNADVVISGHIHKRQQITADKRPVDGRGITIIYVGTPFSQSAADVDQVKGITIFDMATYSQSFHQTPLPTWRRLALVVSEHTTIETVQALVQQDISGSKDHWVLELEGPRAEIVGYIGSKEYLEAIKGVDVKFKPKYTDSEKKKVSIEAKSMDYIISQYVAKVYNGSIDKEELLRRAKDILDESRKPSQEAST